MSHINVKDTIVNKESNMIQLYTIFDLPTDVLYEICVENRCHESFLDKQKTI
jgi:hypothetical protein